MFDARWARRWLLVALVALAAFGLTIAFVPSTTSSGCPPGVLCLVRSNPLRIWLTAVTVIVALLAILAAWFAQRQAR